jgi:hypothetical protein
MSNYQNVVQPLRIGGRDENGQQRTACSLELVAERAAEPTAEAWVDWEAIPVVAGFTREQKAVWRGIWRNGATSGGMLGLSRNQVGAANREILRKLRANLPKLRPYLGYLNQSELFLQNSWSTAQNRANLGYLVRNIRMTITELNEKKTTEAAKLQRISERVHTARVTLEDAESAVARLERALRAEQENAVLDELPWPTPEADKKLSTARAKVVSADSALAATLGAMEKQAQIVEGLEGEIAARRLEGFELALEPAKERAFAAMREFCEAAVELNVLANAHGIHSHQLAASLYPIGRDPLDGLAERLGRCDLLTHAIRFQNELWYRYRKAV